MLLVMLPPTTVQGLASLGLSALAWYAPHQFALARVGLVVLALAVSLDSGALIVVGDALIVLAAVRTQRAALSRPLPPH